MTRQYFKTASLINLLLGLLAGCGGGESQLSETNGDGPSSNGAASREPEVPQGSQPLGLLVTVEQLNDRLDDPNLRILDARPRPAYEAGHIPGAVHVDVNDWKTQALSGNGAGLHDADAWSERVGNLGIDGLTKVVVYAANPTSATRIWWTLKYLGVEEAAVLDGGWPLWQQSGGPISTDVPQVESVDFQPDFQEERLAEIDRLKAYYEAQETVVVDSRSQGEYATGRIPGAVHVEWKDLLAEDGRFKSKDELQALFKERGIEPGKEAVTYCQTGGRASLDAFALELAGFQDVKNYYCSWSQWSADESAPKETD